MSISIYKPNSKNSGAGFSFQMGVDSKSKEPTLFVKSILQHSWDGNKKQGYFKDNLDNPDKNIIVKFNEFEMGHIIHALRTRIEYTTFHSFGDDKTNIKFSPWDKKVKKSVKDSSGNWEEKWVPIPAFGIQFTRNGNQVFQISLEPGESEVIMEYLSFILREIFSRRAQKQAEEIRKSHQKLKDGPFPRDA